MLDTFADMDADIGGFNVAADEPCAGKPMTLTPLPWPGLEVPNASFSTGGCVCVVGCVCWCFNAFVRRFVTATSRFRRGCSTGNTLRRFFGSFERACRSHDQTHTEKNGRQAHKKKKIEMQIGSNAENADGKANQSISYSPIYLRVRIEHREIANDDGNG